MEEESLLIVRCRKEIHHNSVFCLNDNQKIQVKTIVRGHNTGGRYNVLVGWNALGQKIWGPYSRNVAALLWGMPEFKGRLLPRMEEQLHQHLSQTAACGQG
jgi:hypothetical protein